MSAGWGNFTAPGMFPALTLRQPWAWAVLEAGKLIENRPWSTKFRGAFLLHAAAWPVGPLEAMSRPCPTRPWLDALEAASGMLGMGRAEGAVRLDSPVSLRHVFEHRGGFVGVAELVDVLPPCGGLFGCAHPWHMPEQYGFRLANVRRVPFTPWKGALGFFGVPRDVADPLIARAA